MVWNWVYSYGIVPPSVAIKSIQTTADTAHAIQNVTIHVPVLAKLFSSFCNKLCLAKKYTHVIVNMAAM